LLQRPALPFAAEAAGSGADALVLGYPQDGPFDVRAARVRGVLDAQGEDIYGGRGVRREIYALRGQVRPGNSGGPLFNLDGEVIGINSQIYSRTGGFMGVSFAIPINLAMDVAGQLRTSGRVSRGWLGVDIQDVTQELAESFGMSRPEGALVRSVLPDSPAAAAGVEVGDIILKFENRIVHVADELPPLVGRTLAGSKVGLQIMRDGESRGFEITLGELPVEAMPVAAIAPERDKGRLGLTVRELRFGEREALAVDEGGVYVENVVPGPAWDAGVRTGDVILSIDRSSIGTMADFNDAVAELPAGRNVAVLLQRNGTTIFVPLRAGE
ncbi:MAG: PDZ domain-containing protein, partial [Proteobacteria bacterium]|nr:PDZ domain-containing protein [Pseudomonadota bacterium]